MLRLTSRELLHHRCCLRCASLLQTNASLTPPATYAAHSEVRLTASSSANASRGINRVWECTSPEEAVTRNFQEAPYPGTVTTDIPAREYQRWGPQLIDQHLSKYQEMLHGKLKGGHSGAGGDLLHTPPSVLPASWHEEGDALTNLKHLLDHIIQSSSPQKPRWVTEGCLLAFLAGLPHRCGELFFSVPHTAAGAPTLDALPEFLLEAAVLSEDVGSLSRCASLVEAWAEAEASSLLIPTATTSSMFTRSCSTVMAHALRVYAATVVLVSHLSRSKESSTTKTLDTRQAAREIAGRMLRHLLQCPSVKTADAFFDISVRLARYQRDELLVGQTAVYVQQVKYWETQAESTQTAATWMTATVLYTVFRSAVRSRSWAHAAYVSLFVDKYFLLENASPRPAGLTPTEDGIIELMLRYLRAAQQCPHAQEWMRGLMRAFPDYLPSLSVIGVMARISGAARDSEAVLWCLETMMGDRQPHPPSAADLFTCLCECARSGISNIAAIIATLRDHNLLILSEEEMMYVQLLHCRTNPRWKVDVEALLASTQEQHHAQGSDGTPITTSQDDASTTRALFTSRNVYVALLVLAEGEHAQFMYHYRRFLACHSTQGAVEDRARWVVFAIDWLTTQARQAAKSDLTYVALEVQQVLQAASHLPPHVSRSIERKWAILCALHGDQPLRRLATVSTGTPAISPHGIHDNKSDRLVARFSKRRSRLALSEEPADLFADVTHSMLGKVESEDGPRAAVRNAWIGFVRGEIVSE